MVARLPVQAAATADHLPEPVAVAVGHLPELAAAAMVVRWQEPVAVVMVDLCRAVETHFLAEVLRAAVTVDPLVVQVVPAATVPQLARASRFRWPVEFDR